MSLVIAVANMSRVVVKCDGLTRDGKTGEIKSQDYIKMVKLNNNCIVGYTGVKEDCELVLSEYKRLAIQSNVDVETLKPTTVIYDLSVLAKEMNTVNSKISFLVAGREDGKIVLFGFVSKENYQINNCTPTDDDFIKYITLGSDIQQDAIDFSKFYNPDKGIEISMNEYIKYISTIDPTVNDHISTKKIML